jgi:hypothetical protein
LVEIRRLISGDSDELREVRLRALADAPYASSSSLERESVLGPEFWERRVDESASGRDGVVFVATDGERSLGMAGGFFANGTPLGGAMGYVGGSASAA